MTLPLRFGITLVAATLLLAPGIAEPAIVAGAAPSLTIEPSVRAAGMGEASTAVFWGDDPNYWANPAMLGYYKGLRYQWSKAKFWPQFDIYFGTNRLTFGSSGVGLSVAGKPLNGLGGYRLDYGENELWDEYGNLIGILHDYEKVYSWGMGLSLAEFTENVTRSLGWELPAISRFGDFSVGRSWNDVETFLAPGSFSGMGMDPIAQTSTKDRGYVLRFTPYNSIDYPGLVRSVDSFLRPAVGGMRLDLSYGNSVRNYNDAYMTFWSFMDTSFVVKDERRGLAVHLAVGLPGVVNDRLSSAGMGWLAKMITPFISWGKAWDRSTPSRRDPGTGQRLTQGEVKLSGWELTLCNVFTIRRGRTDDPSDVERGIHGPSSGWGIGLRSAQLGGFRYDRATGPTSEDLDWEIESKAFNVWINPLGVWRALDHQSQAAKPIPD
jgi:hypothetical protein